MNDFHDKTVDTVFSAKLQSRIDYLTTELAKTRHALWNEVDKRRKAERTFLELEEMLYRLLEAIDCGIVISDQNGNILKINRCLEKITGYSGEELVGTGFIQLFPNSAHRQKLTMIYASLDGIQDWQIPLKRKNDTICTVLLNINRTELKGQKVLITRIQDITSKKNTERKLKKSTNYPDQHRKCGNIEV